MFMCFGGIFRGWADGNVDSALRHLEQLRGSGQSLGLSYYLSLVAECEARAGDYSRALARVEEALAHASRTGERYYEADLHRLKGTWLLELHSDADDAAEPALRRAIALARECGERPAALRASLVLGRLFDRTGRADAGRELVASACDLFDEQDDWQELQVARAFSKGSV
jgi:adenylate cyclase